MAVLQEEGLAAAVAEAGDGSVVVQLSKDVH